MKLVSVIVPVFNTADYIDTTMNSIVSQGYSDLEIVIVDDGSTDKSGEICDEWARRDDRIKVFHIPNKGPSAARNYAISESSGEYILPVDSDDIIAPDYVEKAVEVLNADNNLGIVYCKAELFGDESGEWKLRQFSIKEMLICNCIFATAMFRRSDFDRVGGYYEGMKSGLEDYDLWLSILELGRAVYQIPEILFYYRKRNASRTCQFESSKEEVFQTEKKKFERHRSLFEKIYRIPNAGEKLVLYGAGGAGKTYYGFLRSIGCDNPIIWVDKNFENIKDTGYDSEIYSPDVITEQESDEVIVALNNLNSVGEVRKELIKRGYKEDKIFWYLNDVEEI